jgi:uncharacterized DUF497 family protein
VARADPDAEMPPRITWDETKESANRREHGVAFREAIEALQDPLGPSEIDESHDLTETRWTRSATSRVVLGVNTLAISSCLPGARCASP